MLKHLMQLLAAAILVSIVGSPIMEPGSRASAQEAHGQQELGRVIAAAYASAYRSTINGFEHDRIYTIASRLLQPSSYTPIPPLEDYNRACPNLKDMAEFCGTDDIYYSHSLLQKKFTTQIACCSTNTTNTNNTWRMRLEGTLESNAHRASRLIHLKGHLNSFVSHLVRDTYQTQDREEWVATFASLTAPLPGISYAPSLPGTLALVLHNLNALILYQELATATYDTPHGEVFSPMAGHRHKGALGIFLDMYAHGDGELSLEG